MAAFSNWCHKNNLLLNTGKSVYIVFFFFFVSNIKLLGTYLDEHLTWSNHIEHMCILDYKEHIMPFLHASFFKFNLPTDCIINVYYPLVHSVLSYNTVPLVCLYLLSEHSEYNEKYF